MGNGPGYEECWIRVVPQNARSTVPVHAKQFESMRNHSLAEGGGCIFDME